MKLTATPFDPATGALLPVYRDAYLRGDLSGASARAVEEYLRRDADQAHGTVVRWHQMQNEAEAPAPSWVQKQLQFVRQQPLRVRRRVLTAVVGTALLAGASMAGTRLPDSGILPTDTLPTAFGEAEMAPAAEASASRVVTVSGRILNEKGQPLVGATVLRKGTATGASTNAKGEYSLSLPAHAANTLQFGYAGYADQELAANANPQTVTLQRQGTAAKAKRRWLIF